MKIQVAFFLSVATVASTAESQYMGADPKYIFSFGDSYTDSRFRINANLPSTACPLGNPECLQGSTWAGGHNWMTGITTVYNKTVTVTYNFANSGDVVDGTIVPGRQSIKYNQYPNFENIQARAPWRSRNTLFSFFIGINDIGATFETGPTRLDDDFRRRMFGAYFGIIDDLYKKGARRFLFLNVPDIARSPKFSHLNSTMKAYLKGAIQASNAELVKRAANFKATHSSVKTYIWDSYTVYNRVWDNPKAYGFPDQSSICKSNCFWNDGYHPTAKAHSVFAKDVAEMLRSNGFW